MDTGLAALKRRNYKADAGDTLYAALMNQIAMLKMLLMSDPLRRQILETVATLNLPDCWIGAGFVRDAVWDSLHGYDVVELNGDVDVIWYDVALSRSEIDRVFEQQLSDKVPGLLWSVKNQARMHLRNNDAPYSSAAEAMRHWPETATAVAARLDSFGEVEINAPLGLEDLFALVLRPTPRFTTDKLSIFLDRVSSKSWIDRYPKLSLIMPETPSGGFRHSIKSG